jgi:UDP-N-acetylmuramoyl-tripeptide--D-alanyl-D-alanine ligase
MEFWSLEGIKSAVGAAVGAAVGTASGATWLARPENLGAIEGVSIDSRAVTPGQVFIAIKGEKHDGHDYLAQAVSGGASLLIVSRELTASAIAALPRQVAVLRVADTGAALLRLAGAYRKTLERTKVIAVAGSNGKTTTTRLIDAVLKGAMRGSASQKSFNNAIGVPLTILGAKRTDQYLICEVGTNAPGEITPLARAIEPDIAVITSIGREHLEGLGSLRGVVQEETSLLGGVRPGACAILNADAQLLVDTVRPGVFGANLATIVWFGASEKADLRVSGVRTTGAGISFAINERNELSLPLLGTHNAMNAAAAVGVARRMGLEWDVIAKGLASVAPAPMRLERVEAGGGWFLNDAYNANPESMLAAFDTFAQACEAMAPKRRVAVLGDMLELGEATADAHAEVARTLLERATPSGAGSRSIADRVVLVGPNMAKAREVLETHGVSLEMDVSHVSALTEAVVAQIAAQLRTGDAVLLKGSRGMGLERVLAAWRARCAEGPNIVVTPGPAMPTASDAGSGPTSGPASGQGRTRS